MNPISISGGAVLRLLVLPLLWVGLLGQAAAQTAPDTTRISYSEETVTEASAPTTSLGSTYSNLARLQIEEKSVWKLGLNNLALPYTGSEGKLYTRYGLYLIYERKLQPDISVMAELSPDITRYRRATDTPTRTSLAVRSQVAGRFYYNLNDRIRKGKSASNFSANYLSLAIGTGFGRRAHETPFYYYDFSKPFVRADLAMLYGLQRRLGQYGFVDFNVGVCTKLAPEIDDFGFTSTLRIGLALGR
ncbi:hypothetical protein MTX78_01565 [Hymenobacter tibetensis]|uniref:DUF3575 domain-containing protein n=1 Tax=Hymenobacter tibetensis TaxID=497967 RepID=A0ABY4CYQ7_9BACT|nr:hypothetical protein [Hymenobacter tibetensis]UOG75298.1 hypothetical protein MTX78_01565 [Hymenobacter tibetensis]